MSQQRKTFVLTTPIYYVNSSPHLGHAYTTVVADAFARFHRQRGRTVLFSTGTDEHGAKAQKAAKEKGLNEQAYVDSMSKIWRSQWEELHISFTDFIRTTSQRHIQVVQQVLKQMKADKHIYEGTYKGWYCVPCESFHKAEDLAEGKRCPNEWCQRQVEWVEEKGYYFKLSAFQKPLLDHYAAHPDAVLPDFRYNEVVSFIQQGLKDVYITRATFSWGVPVPFAPELVTYVWFDALLNYLTVTAYLQDRKKFALLWPADIHFIAKDILRFHAVIWPAMLMALKLPLPNKIFAHGFWKVEQAKMSKSKGVVITPAQLTEWLTSHYGLAPSLAQDVIRFYLFLEVPLGLDGQFAWESFAARYENQLANDLGNLVQRVGKMLKQYTHGKKEEAPLWERVRQEIQQRDREIQNCMTQCDLQGALKTVMEFCRYLNQSIEIEKPWQAFREKDTSRGRAILSNLTQGIKALSFFLQPFLPEASQAIARAFGFDLPQVSSLEEALSSPEAPIVKEFVPLFPKEKRKKEAPAMKSESEQEIDTISYETFQSLDIRIAEVISAERVEGTDKLLKVQLKVGEATVQVVAGIYPHYSPEQMSGKKVVLLKNLKPARIRGVTSQGMLLAADHHGKPCLLAPEEDLPSGTKVR